MKTEVIVKEVLSPVWLSGRCTRYYVPLTAKQALALCKVARPCDGLPRPGYERCIAPGVWLRKERKWELHGPLDGLMALGYSLDS